MERRARAATCSTPALTSTRSTSARTAGFLSVGAIEPQFYAELLARTGLTDDAELARQQDRSAWPALKERLADVFRTKTRDEWALIFDGSDACVTPVLSLAEAPSHPHLVARGTFTEHEGIVQPAPAPRFSRTAPSISRPPAHPGQHTDEVLADWGVVDPARTAALRQAGAIA